MPESDGNDMEIVEIAHRLDEAEHKVPHLLVEWIEAIILAVVAVTTAWSGYEAARWSAGQSILYARSSGLRAEGQTLDVESIQAKQFDAAIVMEWLTAEFHGDAKLAEFFARHMRTEFKPAFDAWQKTDPVHNPDAPSTPMVMPEYRNARADEAERKNKKAADLFQQGTRAREIADNYVRVTVGLATVLFLTAMSQKFGAKRIRAMLVAVALALLCLPLWHVLTLPRM